MQVINFIKNSLTKLWANIKGFFLKNIGRKIISLVIAAFIWVIVVNISNPEVSVEQTVEITVNYADALEDANKTYTLETTLARVNYTIRSNNRRLVSADDFTAYVNLIDYSVTGSVPVYVDVDPSVSSYVSDISVRPIVVRVETEDMVEKSFNIDVNIEGSAAEGKAVGELEMESDTLTLYGPSSDIGRIASVGVNIAVNYADADVSGVAVPVFYDSSGNELELDERTTTRETLSYVLHIYNTKRLAILIDYSGVPAQGYTVSSVTSDPTSVLVYGPDELINRYSNIVIPSSVIDVSGATRNVAVLVDAGNYLPEGINLVDSGDVSVVANVVRSSTLSESSHTGTSEKSESSEVDLSTEASGESESFSETETSASVSHTSQSTEGSSHTSQNTEATSESPEHTSLETETQESTPPSEEQSLESTG